MDIRLVFEVLITVLLGVIGWTINSQKAAFEKAIDGLRDEIKTLQNKMEGMMSEKRCIDHHDSHDKIHERLEKDINNIGELAREAMEKAK